MQLISACSRAWATLPHQMRMPTSLTSITPQQYLNESTSEIAGMRSFEFLDRDDGSGRRSGHGESIVSSVAQTRRNYEETRFVAIKCHNTSITFRQLTNLSIVIAEKLCPAKTCFYKRFGIAED